MKKYGHYGYDKESNCFVVACDPHVAIRLKRVFPRLRGSHGTFRLSASPDAALDLEWFLARYPMNGDDGGVMASLAAKQREQISIVDSLLSNLSAPTKIDLAIPLREYQQIAATLALTTGRLLLADDVGLGKTASSIGIFSDPKTLPAVVVTLTHLPLQWKKEIERFAPALQVHIVKKGQPYDFSKKMARSGQLSLGCTPDVLIINYHKLSGWADTLAHFANSIIFDECQELRKCDSFKYKAAKHIASHASYRMGLSATPIYNHGGELFNVMECLAPGALGSHSEFTTEWCGWGDQVTNPKAFGTYLRESGLMLRRTRQDVNRELPALSVVPYTVEADTAALDRVSVSCAELARIILSQGEAFRGQKMQVSEELSNRLRQATGIAKAPYVAEFVRLLVESGERVVLYGWHREVYSIWLDQLKEYKPAMHTGSESPVQKDQAKAAFISGESKVLFISLRAGAGLDGLQSVSRTVVFGELDWSPGVHEQCIGRVYRDGQPEPVLAYFLVAETGADPIMADVLGLKRQQIEGVRDPNQDLVSQLQTDGGHIKRLAEEFLKSNNLSLQKEEVAA